MTEGTGEYTRRVRETRSRRSDRVAPIVSERPTPFPFYSVRPFMSRIRLF